MFEKFKRIYEIIINSIKFNNKRKQLDTLSYEKVIELMKQKGTFEEFESDLNNFEKIEELMRDKSNLHGINHVVRVLFNAYAVTTLENVNAEDRKIVIEAAKLHDIGRVSDGEDEENGNQSAIKARKMLEDKGFSAEEINLICFIIKEHSLPRTKNEKDIEELPEALRQRYKYCLKLLKDADKLDRVRLGDLDSKRLSTDSAKRLVGVAKDVFENNRHYYKKKMKVYPFNEEEAKKLLEQIKEVNPEIDIDLDEIKKKYSKYKAIQEQGKIQWFKHKSSNMKLSDFTEIISVLSKEDEEYIKYTFLVGVRAIIGAIHTMGIDKFLQLKSNNNLQGIMNIRNYKKVLDDLTKEERDLLLDFRKYDSGNQVLSKFYLYYLVIKRSDQDEIDMILLNNEDKRKYWNSRAGNDKSGYKWKHDILKLPCEYEITAILNVDKKLFLEIREKLNIPLNVMLTAVCNLELLKEEIDPKDLEKILLNYYRFNLNVQGYKDREQVKKLLINLPESIDDEYYEKVRECTVGRFRRFKLEEFEQVKNCEEICDERILEEFGQSEDVNELRKMIFETKVKDLNGIKRDIYFYKKYMGEKAKENRIFNLFEILFESQDKMQLLTAYSELNNISTAFDLDDALDGIRGTLAEISKEDVVSKMRDMEKRIQNAPTRGINGQPVIDLTGTDFNLLISVIGASGSPYLVNYRNRQVRKLKKYESKRKLYNIMSAKFDVDVERGTKLRIAKRYILDPLKNKQRCASSIDQDFMGHIRSYENREGTKQTKEKLILAYFPQSKKDIFYMGNDDLMSSYDKDRSDPTRKRIPHRDNMSRVCNLKLQDLNTLTTGNDNEVIMDAYPGAVMCFDEVSNVARRTAKRLNIPILYIDSKRQFEIMKSKIDEYYVEMQDIISQAPQMSEETFERAFNEFENNIIHSAFKMAIGFSFLDKDEYPKEQVQELLNKMKSLVSESLSHCNDTQREEIRTIMKKEANVYNVRYGNYLLDYIDFKGLHNLVKEQEESDVEK